MYHSHSKTALAIFVVAMLAACSKQEAASDPAPASAMLAAECDKLPDPPRTDDSASSKSVAVSQGAAAREACRKQASTVDKGNADLARIRQIQEREEAEKDSRKISDAEYGRRVKEAGAAPLKQYK